MSLPLLRLSLSTGGSSEEELEETREEALKGLEDYENELISALGAKLREYQSAVAEIATRPESERKRLKLQLDKNFVSDTKKLRKEIDVIEAAIDKFKLANGVELSNLRKEAGLDK